MHPLLPGDYRAYPVFIALGVATGVLVSLVSARRAGLPAHRFLAMSTVIVAAGLLGAKLHGGPLGPPTNGMRYPGGLVLALLALPLARRLALPGVSSAHVADVVAPSIGMAMAVERIGCFLAGCCHGTVTHVPWAVRFPAFSEAWNAHVANGLINMHAPVSLPVHPLQIYFALASLGTAALAWWLQHHRTHPGQAALVFLAVDGLAKYALEALRAPSQSVPHLRETSLAIAVAATLTLTIVSLVRARVHVPVTLAIGPRP